MIKKDNEILEYCLKKLDSDGVFPSLRTIWHDMEDVGALTTISRSIARWTKSEHLKKGRDAVGNGYYGWKEYPRLLQSVFRRINLKAKREGNVVTIKTADGKTITFEIHRFSTKVEIHEPLSSK